MRMIMISGQAASGKTTGVETLDAKTTVALDCDGKGLSWTGWKKAYNVENKNYFKPTTVSEAYKYIKAIHDKRTEVKVIVLDTISTLMSNSEMEILKNPSRDQWADHASEVYELFKLIRELEREDLTIVVMSHIEIYDVNGVQHSRIKTNGKKLTKINLNSFLTYNLYTKVTYDGGEAKYELITVSDGTTEARAMKGVFEPVIPNDLKMVIDTIIEKEN